MPSRFDPDPRPRISRRHVLLGALGLTLPLAGPNRFIPSAYAQGTEYPFTLGVASGEPTPDGIVLWTRLCPDPLNGGGTLDEEFTVEWQIVT